MHARRRPVVRCPLKLRAEALRVLHDRLPAEQQAALVQALRSVGVDDARSWDGLFIVPVANNLAPADIANVAWVQSLPGKTAYLWISPELGDAGESLLQAAAQFVDEQDIPLAQMVASPADGYSSEMCRAGGFPWFAELIYLYVELANAVAAADAGESSKPTADVDSLRFVGRAGDAPARLGRLLERTYAGTLDCPALEGVRAMPDVLAGYRAQGQYLPNQWYLVQRAGQDVGAIIMADHPGFGNWELIYMGLVPEARGHGLGERLVRFAMCEAARNKAERLVLAVDSENWPALALYRRAGLIEWDRRIVYARLHSSA